MSRSITLTVSEARALLTLDALLDRGELTGTTPGANDHLPIITDVVAKLAMKWLTAPDRFDPLAKETA